MYSYYLPVVRTYPPHVHVHVVYTGARTESHAPMAEPEAQALAEQGQLGDAEDIDKRLTAQAADVAGTGLQASARAASRTRRTCWRS